MIHLRNLKRILVISISIGICSASYSQVGITYFADKLFDEGKYKSAIVEYERLNFFYPDSHFQYRIGVCYQKLGNLDKAAAVFGELGAIASMELINTYIELGGYSLARFAAEDLNGGENLIAWLYTMEGRWDEGAQVFENIGKNDLKSAVLQGKTLPYKSERLAHLFSTIVPGMGEIYAKKFVAGIITFSLNAITGCFAVKSVREHRYLDGTLITIFFWNRFYSGGIENARNAVRGYNKNLKDRYIKHIKEKYKSPL